MAESLLLEWADKFKGKEDFCFLCLRSEKERRLETPVHIKTFMEGIFLKVDLPFQKVCIVCESESAIAHKILLASKFANQLFSAIHLIQTTHKRKILRNALKSKKNGTKIMYGPEWLQELINCEFQLRKHRNKSMNTEVSKLPTEKNDKNIILKHNDLCIVPDISPRNAKDTNNLTDNNAVIESVVILDDDTKLPTNEVSINNETIASNRNPTMQYTDIQNTGLVLHPVVFESGKMIVPSLSAGLGDGLLTNGEIAQFAILDGGKLNILSNPNEINSTLTKLSHAARSKGNKAVKKRVRCKEPEKEATEAKLNCDQINWEDKIPMDVISFVNEKKGEDVCFKRPKVGVGIRVPSGPTNDIIDLS